MTDDSSRLRKSASKVRVPSVFFQERISPLANEVTNRIRRIVGEVVFTILETLPKLFLFEEYSNAHKKNLKEKPSRFFEIVFDGWFTKFGRGSDGSILRLQVREEIPKDRSWDPFQCANPNHIGCKGA